jgi:hypothetical protein
MVFDYSFGGKLLDLLKEIAPHLTPATGGPNMALGADLAYYVICLLLTWRFYLRRS